MSGVHRLLTRKDKGHHATSNKSPSGHGIFGGVFVNEEHKKLDKEEDKKVKKIQGRIQSTGITTITDANIQYALHAPSVNGNIDEAYRLCMLLEDTFEGLVKPYNPNTKLLGAINREAVSCYLDALLFAMFARLDSFEAILYDSLEDVSRKKLAGILRLWVNMLRSGRLITVDITQHVQAALAECGWEAAGKIQQQDVSEAFSFITDQLQLPLLTLKMDLFHTGKEDLNDDHKFVNERLLEVALLSEPPEGESVITLEACLEAYFNNRIEIKRHLAEQQRRNTLKSLNPAEDTEKTPGLHIETLELPDRNDSPVPESPLKSPLDKLRPTAGRKRQDSIFSQRRVRLSELERTKSADGGPMNGEQQQQRKTSVRTEVLMPAWQFFRLLPWYTDNVPTSDAQVAAHFARKRPVLGICLKRYTFDNQGRSSRLDTYVDIPLEINVPDFVSSDDFGDSTSIGNFKLVLQSVVCHRGKSVHSGHYVSLVRGHAANAASQERPDSSSSDDDTDTWMLFDDLAKERVTYVDITETLKKECPYLLFYQVQPIADDESIGQPPSYIEAMSRSNSEPNVDLEKSDLPEYTDKDIALVDSFSPLSSREAANIESFDWDPSTRTSMDAGNVLDDARGRPSMSSNRGSIAFDDASMSGSQKVGQDRSVPGTPLDDSRAGFLQLPSRRGSRQSSGRKSKSRPTSQAPDSNRFSLNMSKLTNRMSRGDLAAMTTAGPPLQMSGSEGSVESLAPELVAKEEEPSADKTKVLKKEREKEKKSKGKHHEHRNLKKSKERPDRDCIVM